MVARVMMQRRAAPLTAAFVAGGITFYPRVAHAEAPETDDRFPSKKPIYDDLDVDTHQPPAKATSPAATRSGPSKNLPSIESTKPTVTSILTSEPQPTEYVRAQTPTARLAAQIRLMRLSLHRRAVRAEDSLNHLLTRAFSLEESFTSTLASLAPSPQSGERLMPGLIYVLVAGMAGSVAARNRNILFHTTYPLVFAGAAAAAVLPVTSQNVADLAWRWERESFPAVADAQLRARAKVESFVRTGVAHSRMGGQMLEDKIGEAREKLESWVRNGK